MFHAHGKLTRDGKPVETQQLLFLINEFNEGGGVRITASTTAPKGLRLDGAAPYAIELVDGRRYSVTVEIDEELALFTSARKVGFKGFRQPDADQGEE